MSAPSFFFFMDLNFNSFNKYIFKSYGHCFDAMVKVSGAIYDNAGSDLGAITLYKITKN